MEFLRTPDDRFAELPGYDFSPNYYLNAEGLRMHYLDANPTSDKVIVCLHGEPSWSYLYRKMIPGLVAGGYRVIVPDLIGFGRSDKPIREEDYTYLRHVDWMRALLFTHLQLQSVHLFVQDWGGLIGLRLVGEHPDAFAKVAAANTFLPTGDQTPSPAFEQWKAMARGMNPFPVGDILQMASLTHLSPKEIAAYDAPFPEESYKAGARIFPELVPTSPTDPAAPANRRAWEVLRKLETPFLTLFSDSDPITKGAEKYLQQHIPGAKGQAHQILAGGGHFLQEDVAEELIAGLLPFFTA